ncbi:MAG: transketolase [bacterium]|jgi:transketolase
MSQILQGQSQSLDQLCANTIRGISIDAIQAANSGHPGLPMGMASVAYSLWAKHMKYNPKNPKWINRDRFVLSAGHGSALLYSILHLTGFDLSLEEVKNFRQWGSKTPGHPEYGHTPGVEATTGPLGQGIGNAVGMAIAEKYLAAYFNQDGHKIIDYNIYALSGDGCLQEGISSEASSLAGHLGLDNLVVVYDDNNITIDGDTSLSFTEDVAKRYESYGWFVQSIDGDGNDLDAFDKAIEKAKQEKNRPSLIKVKSIIGFGSPNRQGTSGIHGSPLGDDEIKLTKENLGLDPEKTFHIPEPVKTRFAECVEQGQALEKEWNESLSAYQTAHPELSAEFDAAAQQKFPEGWQAKLPTFEAGKKIATRSASGQVLNAVMPSLPMVLGGSADLTPSNNTFFTGAENYEKSNEKGRYIRYGVREHAMGAIMNGIAVSDMLIPYAATFLCFSDYMRPSIRLAAMSNYGSIFVFTHDSIGLGEDGPTHQPVEHVSSLRAIPNLPVFRPADANETAQVWKYALENRGTPVLMALTRQGVPALDQEKYASASNVAKGAYTLTKVENPQVLLLATGSEVSIALEAHEELTAQGIASQVVSMPSFELFEKQPDEYKESVLPSSITARVAVEAGIKQGWGTYLGSKGAFIGIETFGYSAPAGEIYQKVGIHKEGVVEAAKAQIK